MIGDLLEKSGWRQGSIVQQENNSELLKHINCTYKSEDVLFVVATQSCDIANNNIESDPYIELSAVHLIESLDGNLTYNKNPRTLHTTLQIYTENSNIIQTKNIELKAFEKHLVLKKIFTDFPPDNNIKFKSADLEAYVAWLASRYSRPALPTTFNDRISAADAKNNLRKNAKNSNHSLSGIYVKITPDAEISEDQNYSVNLLGLVSADFNGNLENVEITLDEYAEV